MKLKNLALLGAVAALFISCGSTPSAPVQSEAAAPKIMPKPAWVDNPDNEFDKDIYIARVGEGYTKAEAAQDAERQLAKYFGENINSATVAKESYRETSDDVSKDRSIDKVFTVTFDTELFTVNRTKPWYDPDYEVYYVCAYLNRQDTFEAQYKPVIIDAKTEFYKYFDFANAEEDIFRKISFLKDAKRIGDSYQAILNDAQVLVPSIANVYKKDLEDIASVEYLLKETQSKAAVKIEVNGDYGTKIANYLSKVFTKNGFIVSDSNYHYEVVANIERNRVTDEMSGMLQDTPSIKISLNKKGSGDSPFSYEKVTKSEGGYHEFRVEEKCFNDIQTELNNSFEAELQYFLKNH